MIENINYDNIVTLSKITCSVSRLGDLRYKTYIEVTLPVIKIYTRDYNNFIIIENNTNENKIKEENKNINIEDYICELFNINYEELCI